MLKVFIFSNIKLTALDFWKYSYFENKIDIIMSLGSNIQSSYCVANQPSLLRRPYEIRHFGVLSTQKCIFFEAKVKWLWISWRICILLKLSKTIRVYLYISWVRIVIIPGANMVQEYEIAPHCSDCTIYKTLKPVI